MPVSPSPVPSHASSRWAVLWARCGTIFRLGIKELWSLWRDPMMLVLIVYTTTLAVYSAGKAQPETLNHVPIAIVDEHVQTAPLGNDLFIQLLHGLVVAQIDRLGHDLVVGVDLLEGGQRLGAGLFVVAEEVDLRATREEALDGCETDPTTAAGYQNDFAFEFIFKHDSLSFLNANL